LETGFNYRMTDVQAAIGLVQLGRLDAIVAQRRELAARYRELLSDIEGLQPVRDPAWGTTNYQSFWVLLPAGGPTQREVLAHLASDGIAARRGIMAAHLEPAYAGHPHAELPITERLSTGSVILPLHHRVSDSDQDKVAQSLRRLFLQAH
jgi:perosamine synthetase